MEQDRDMWINLTHDEWLMIMHSRDYAHPECHLCRLGDRLTRQALKLMALTPRKD